MVTQAVPRTAKVPIPQTAFSRARTFLFTLPGFVREITKPSSEPIRAPFTVGVFERNYNLQLFFREFLPDRVAKIILIPDRSINNLADAVGLCQKFRMNTIIVSSDLLDAVLPGDVQRLLLDIKAKQPGIRIYLHAGNRNVSGFAGFGFDGIYTVKTAFALAQQIQSAAQAQGKRH